MPSPPIDRIAEAMRAALVPLNDEGRRIAVAVYKALANGDPVATAEIAGRADVPEEDVRARLDAWPGVYLDDQGSVVGFWGLAIPEMPHRFQADGGKPIHAWCAIDPFLITPVLGRSARVRSRDPVSGEPIAMTLTPEGIDTVTPQGAAMSFLVPDGPFDHDVIQSFCHSVLNFASRETAERWTASHPGTLVIDIDAAAEIGRRAWEPLIDAAAG